MAISRAQVAPRESARDLDFDTIVIAGRSEDHCVPCGTCRQVMMEFAPDLTVICLNGKGESKRFALKELLPYGFDQSWL